MPYTGLTREHSTRRDVGLPFITRSQYTEEETSETKGRKTPFSVSFMLALQ